LEAVGQGHRARMTRSPRGPAWLRSSIAFAGRPQSGSAQRSVNARALPPVAAIVAVTRPGRQVVINGREVISRRFWVPTRAGRWGVAARRSGVVGQATRHPWPTPTIPACGWKNPAGTAGRNAEGLEGAPRELAQTSAGHPAHWKYGGGGGGNNKGPPGGGGGGFFFFFWDPDDMIGARLDPAPHIRPVAPAPRPSAALRICIKMW